MYLTKYILDRTNPSSRQALIDIQDMHRNIMARFNKARADSGVLYRLDDRGINPVIYVLSKDPPLDLERKDMQLAGGHCIDEYIESLKTGACYSFDILAVPAKKIIVEGSKNSRRVVLKTSEERTDWMRKKANQNGFEILQINEMEPVNCDGKKESMTLRIRGFHYQGVLKVIDKIAFQKAFCNGIGPEKAYGFGMILLKHG